MGVSFLELVDPNDSQEVLRSILSTLRRGGIRQASVFFLFFSSRGVVNGGFFPAPYLVYKLCLPSNRNGRCFFLS